MKHFLLIVIFCTMLVSSVAQAGEKTIIYFSFDNVRGDTVEDLSGSGNDGTLIDNPDVVDAHLGEGLEFTKNHVAIAASASLNGDFFQDAFTLVVWINPTLTGDAWQAIFTSEGEPKSRDTLFLNIDGTLSWRGRVDGAWAGGMCETVAGVVPADQWTHVAVVSDESHFRVYVNGEVSKETDYQKTDGGNEEYYLGDTPFYDGQAYNGVLDEFAIIARPLSDAEIGSIIANGVEVFIAVEPGNKAATQWGALKRETRMTRINECHESSF